MSKINNKNTTESLSVQLRRPFNRLVSKKNAAISDIHAIAKQLKDRLSHAAKSLTATTVADETTMMEYCLSPSSPLSTIAGDDKDDVTMETVSPESSTTAPTTPDTNTDIFMTTDLKAPLSATTLSDVPHNNKRTTKTTTTLRNLHLLQQYLLFISKETNDIQWNSSNRELTFQRHLNKTSSSFKDLSDPSARLGATLIESLVHDSPMLMEQKLKHLQVGSKSVVLQQQQQQQQQHDRRRKPGRPPKNSVNSETNVSKKHKSMMEHPYSLPPRLTEKQKKKKENCNTIHCICDTPHEEFGSMVQCDDCYHWLHVECLELDDEALGEEEPFRCPLCFLSMGNIYKDGKRNAKNPKMLSSITWRYAAQWKSRLLADSARYNHHSTDDEYDDDDDDDDMIMDDVCTFAHPLEVDENFTVQHPSPLSQPFTSTSTAPLTADTTVLAPFTLPPSPLTPINYIPPQLQPFEAAATAAATTSFMTQTVNEEDDNSSTAEDLTTGPVTPTSTDWPDISSESRYSISSQDSLSTISSVCTSEVTTPTTEFYSSSALTAAAALAAASSTSTTGGGGVYASDPFDVKEMNQLLFNQTVESLEILHQLVYLESSLLHNRPPKVFSPHASDVFLCGDNLAKDSTTTAFTLPSTSMMTHEKTPSTPSTPSILPSSKASITAPPSDVCSQDLSEYSFDSGPFWSPLY